MDTSNPLSLAKIKQVQRIIGTLLYCSNAMDPIMVVDLSSIVAWQVNGTDDVLFCLPPTLGLCCNNPNTTTNFLANNMVLMVHSDASYLSDFGEE